MSAYNLVYSDDFVGGFDVGGFTESGVWGGTAAVSGWGIVVEIVPSAVADFLVLFLFVEFFGMF